MADGSDEFLQLVQDRGLTLYPHQEEAALELFAGNNVILATPTGSGKSLVAAAAHFAALADDRVSFYTAPIKALVNEKFFELCALFGAENVGMLTGDASVNAEAPVICCTAEVLANLALRQGEVADIGLVVMDEFHYYGEPDRGWAWQVPLLALPQAQFLLMSATLGDTRELAQDLTRRNGRDTALVDQAERPVPLTFSWSLSPLSETLEELLETHQAPVYVVHFTQAAAVEHATSLLTGGPQQLKSTRQEIADRIGTFRFGAGFGRTLSKLLRRGIGVHHAGMLPRYRRLVEQLAQAGLLEVICGTDTLGVGINVPIRTVLFTGLAKFDGARQRVLRTREFQQIAGRAGRPGFDTAGYVVVQAPEHVIDNERAKAKSAAKNAANSKKKSKPHLKKAPEGTVVWTEATFDKLVQGTAEPLQSRMKVDNAMLLNVLAREQDAFGVLRDLLMDSHEPRRSQLKLARRALRLGRSLISTGVVTRLDQPDQFGRRFVPAIDLPDQFALNQPLSHFALAAFDLLDPESDSYSLDLLSIVESVLEGPRQILFAQQNTARGEAVAQMKADGLDYDERMALLEDITWPQPLSELIEAAFEIYLQTHPWVRAQGPEPKSIVRLMWEQSMTFTDFCSRFQLARSEGLVLRYLTDTYRALRQVLPDQHRTPDLDDLIEWLGLTIRQTDSSLLDEWEALADPEHVPTDVAHHEPPPPPRPISESGRPFEVMIRNAMFARVLAMARDDITELGRLERDSMGRLVEPGASPWPEGVLGEVGWDEALEEYYAEYQQVRTDAEARGPQWLSVGAVEQGHSPLAADDERRRVRAVVQTILDPEDHRDWVIEAIVDCDASDQAGELVLVATRCGPFS